MNRNTRYILTLILLVWIAGCSSHSSDDQSSEVHTESSVGVIATAAEKYYVRDGLAYDVNTDQPFTGKQFYYYENGQPMEEMNFKDGNWHGPYITWHENGHKALEENYNENGQTGRQSYWFENGQKEREGNYDEQGALDGLQSEWHEDGKQASQSNWRNGTEYGVSTSWYPSGQKEIESIYNDQGVAHGLSSTWYEDGQKSGENIFNAGTLERGLTWDEKGRITRDGTLQDGCFHLVYTVWHANGQKAKEITSRDDEMVSIVQWDEAGQKTSEKSGQDDGHSEAEKKSGSGQPHAEKVVQEQSLKKLSAEEVADLLADEIGRWKITGKNMPAGGDVEPFEDTMETRWKVKDKSIVVTFSPLINGKRVPFVGDKQYDSQAGVFIWRRKGEGLAEIVSREQYDPATKTYRAETTYPDGAKETTTFKRVSKIKSLFSSQVELDGKIVFSREAIFTRLPDSEDKAEHSDHDHGEAERKNSPGQPPVEKTVGERPSTPEAAVKHALELISAGDVTTFLTTYMPPEALQKEVDRAGSLEQLAAKLEPFVYRVVKVALLEMDRKTPAYSDDGKTATYKIYDVSELDEAVFKKIGARWYLEP